MHRDITCSNILINKQGAVKIIDFGVAKMFLKNKFCLSPGNKIKYFNEIFNNNKKKKLGNNSIDLLK